MTTSTWFKIHEYEGYNVQFSILKNYGKRSRNYTGIGLGVHLLKKENVEEYILLGNGNRTGKTKYLVFEPTENLAPNFALEIFQGYKILDKSHLSIAIQPYLQLRTNRRQLDINGTTGRQLHLGIKLISSIGVYRKNTRVNCFKF